MLKSSGDVPDHKHKEIPMLNLRICKTCGDLTSSRTGECLLCVSERVGREMDAKAIDRIQADVDACKVKAPLLDAEQDAMDAAEIAREQDAFVRRTMNATVRRLHQTGGVM